MKRFPTDRYGLTRRERAIDLGYTDEALAAATRSGDLVRLATGVYLSADRLPDGPSAADEQFRLQSIGVATTPIARGTRSAIWSPGVLSHDSAAALHGLPTLHPDHSAVHFTNGRPSGGFRRGHRHVHSARLADDEVTVIDGVAVTTLERTAVDLALAGDFAQALVVFDAGLRKTADRPLMSDMIAARHGRRGCGVARRSLDLANHKSESVGESWSRAQLIEAGLPSPDLQVSYRCGHHRYRTDFSWAGLLVGEFDGLEKYGRKRRAGESLRDAFLREKRREDDLRALGLMVIRWIWADLVDGTFLIRVREWIERLGISSVAA